MTCYSVEPVRDVSEMKLKIEQRKYENNNWIKLIKEEAEMMAQYEFLFFIITIIF